MNTIALRLFPFVLLFTLAIRPVSGQGTKADYERMSQLGSLTGNKVFRVDVRPNWLPDGEHFWYRVQTGAKSFEFVFVDLQQASRQPAFDHGMVAEQLSKASGHEFAANELPFASIQFSEDLDSILFEHDERDWKINRSDGMLAPAEAEDLKKVANGKASVALRPSVDKGGELHVEFVNESEGDIRTIWIDRGGRRVPYQTIAKGESYRQHTFAGHVWLVVDSQGKALAIYEANDAEKRVVIDGETKIDVPRPRREKSRLAASSTSPDDRYAASVKDHQLFVRDRESNEEFQLSEKADENNFFDQRFYWSPDSRYLVAFQIQPGEERQIHIIESSPRDQLQPKLHQLTYVKPGDRIRSERPQLFDVQQRKEIETDASLFENPWSLSDFRWQADSSEFSFLFNQRGHQVLRIVGIDPTNGRTRAIVDEVAKTFVDYNHKFFSHYLEETGEIIWMSERGGWNHLYLYDRQSGTVKNQITKGQWVVRGVDSVDEENRQIWFRASGIVPGQDPYFVHVCRVNFDGSGLAVMTSGNGTHVIQYSPNKEYLIDAWSRVDLPAVTTVRRVEDGSLVCELEQGDWHELLATGWKPTIPFSAKGRDGETDIYGVIYLPTNFNPDQKYPVIEYIYAGPHDSFVPKQFSAHQQTREMAELGFIVVQIDGMGTSNRSKAFHDVCWKNLGDSGFPDRILWLKAAAEKFPQMDLSRVGIYGGSAGGQSALRGLLAHGDFYRAAVADCGCHDNRMDKIWWNELWMSWPVGPHYEEQSNVTNAHKLQGKLLLIAGELDRNVDPASTMQVVDALIRADKDFDLLVVPGAGHGVGSGKYGMRRTRDFFVRHLLYVEPRGEYHE